LFVPTPASDEIWMSGAPVLAIAAQINSAQINSEQIDTGFCLFRQSAARANASRRRKISMSASATRRLQARAGPRHPRREGQDPARDSVRLSLTWDQGLGAVQDSCVNA
jgi:hypothetical protein